VVARRLPVAGHELPNPPRNHATIVSPAV
jgi:hypothetical protein